MRKIVLFLLCTLSFGKTINSTPEIVMALRRSAHKIADYVETRTLALYMNASWTLRRLSPPPTENTNVKRRGSFSERLKRFSSKKQESADETTVSAGEKTPFSYDATRSLASYPTRTASPFFSEAFSRSTDDTDTTQEECIEEQEKSLFPEMKDRLEQFCIAQKTKNEFSIFEPIPERDPLEGIDPAILFDSTKLLQFISLLELKQMGEPSEQLRKTIEDLWKFYRAKRTSKDQCAAS